MNFCGVLQAVSSGKAFNRDQIDQILDHVLAIVDDYTNSGKSSNPEELDSEEEGALTEDETSVQSPRSSKTQKDV